METTSEKVKKIQDIRFKSYYVVWKQKREYGVWEIGRECLNRTMQYGN